jgi:hypothetical protein
LPENTDLSTVVNSSDKILNADGSEENQLLNSDVNSEDSFIEHVAMNKTNTKKIGLVKDYRFQIKKVFYKTCCLYWLFRFQRTFGKKYVQVTI